MSFVSSRPRVRSVSSTAGVEVGLAVLLFGGLALALSRSGEGVSERLRTSTVPAEPEELKAAPVLREDLRVRRDAARAAVATEQVTATDAIKAETLLALAATPYAAAPSVVAPALKALTAATTTDEARRAADALTHVVEVSHTTVLTAAIVTACSRASVAAGFTDVATQVTEERGAVTRVIATDAAGRSLVTEIRSGVDRAPSIETEVVGVHDGSCAAILDTFDKALEREGVRSDRPTRHATGGVCQLVAAKDLLTRTVGKFATRRASTDQGARRAQRLNAPRPKAPTRRS